MNKQSKLITSNTIPGLRIGHVSNKTKEVKNVKAEVSKHVYRYPCSSNLGGTWSMGFLLIFFLFIQVTSGIALSMYYIADVDKAFYTVHTHIFRNVPNGWLFLYLHANGATMLFAVMYLHMVRGIYYRAFTRVGMWVSGMALYLLMMASAFTGYVLPWGQMSYWALTVITNFFTALPYIGQDITHWIWGGEAISSSTLRRFFSLHFILPLFAIALSAVHVIHLHTDGSVSHVATSRQISVLWLQTYLLKDLLILNGALFIFAYITLKAPDMFGHPDNWVPADPTVTPAHIVPEWYFLPFYGIVKSIPHKAGGIGLMFAYILSPLVLPWIDRAGPGPDGKIRPAVINIYIAMFCIMLFLGWIGYMPVNTLFSWAGSIATGLHFLLLISLGFFSRSRPK